MIFKEQKTEKGFTYDVEDVFGSVHLESPVQLSGDILDEMIVLLLRQNIRSEIVVGHTEYKDGIITYRFQKAPTWTDDDDEEETACTDTPTSTQKRESVYTRMRRFAGVILNWLRRFVEAFREAWKKTKPGDRSSARRL